MITIELELYEVKDNLHVMLDSIIESVSKCHKYTNTMIEFSLFAYEKDGVKHISIANTDPNRPDYSSCKGVFYYKDYLFSYSGEFLYIFFHNTKQIEQHECIDPEKLRLFSGPDDRWSYWNFIYEGEDIKCISLVNCDYFWIDEEYTLAIYSARKE